MDDFRPAAAEERGDILRLFFSTSDDRAAAGVALERHRYLVKALEVDDEDWARRSQQDLTPITVGRITILPTPHSLLPTAHSLVPTLDSPVPTPYSPIPTPYSPVPTNPQPPTPNPYPIPIVIEPSMGFGTGHHATTRLCLAALERIDLTHAFVLDVGTGSGVLAIAAARLGAAGALGIDSDPDAIQSARDNLALNPEARHVRFQVADFTTAPISRADVVTANLTGALLVRVAPSLVNAVNPGGTLIVSGILAADEADVRRSFSEAESLWDQREDEWVCVALRRVKN